MKFLTSIVALALAIVNAHAQTSPEWGQCGGIGWTGSTACVSGTACVVVNPYYSQCIRGASSSAPAPSSTSTRTSTTVAVPTTTSPSTPVSTGFVKTSGTEFTLDGKKFTAVGANSYWVGLFGLSSSDMDKAFADIAATGATTVRGFNEVTSPNGIYYQSWSGGKPTVNTGSTGLQNFDNLVALAKKHGLRLIVALTNNWSDYGGMDVYVNQILGSSGFHDSFYTNDAVKTAFKSYVQTFVTRYLNEPTILGWELANEPRCSGSPGTNSGTCTTKTITNWATELSAFIKSIDKNHLVAIGDEGFYNDPGNAIYVYQGGEGVDFDANLKISSIDFGTFHESWGEGADPTGFGNQWITDHAASMKAQKKPVIMEEFGTTGDKQTTYTSWYSTILSSGLTGDLIWQAGSVLTNGPTANDGYAIYPTDPVYQLDTTHAAALKARA
ncbi:mannanase [Dendrothele bispora CBS 962.96]|uniref:mannan endo-1,4-beta-mannosidase n=1 Tax=Dendrothele bispora (strain CBS 962.96) TaxID=1314807 RepID=A0A4S8LVK5_DENBC|nr:mannanase [Dendrothele bispora CBS 962.96]